MSITDDLPRSVSCLFRSVSNRPVVSDSSTEADKFRGNLRPRYDPAHLGDLTFPVAGDRLDPNGKPRVRSLDEKPLPEGHSDVTRRLGGSV